MAANERQEKGPSWTGRVTVSWSRGNEITDLFVRGIKGVARREVIQGAWGKVIVLCATLGECNRAETSLPMEHFEWL